MKRHKIIQAFLVINVLLAIGAIGFVMSVGRPNTVNLDCVIGNPDEWMGKKANVEGVVGFVTDDMFILWNTCLDSSITVKCQDEPPACQSCRVVVTGDITTEENFDAERPLILAEDWDYVEP